MVCAESRAVTSTSCPASRRRRMIGRKTTGWAGAVMSIQIRRGVEPSGRGGCSDLQRRGGVELEHDAGDLDVVAGLEARGLERADHPEPVQAALHVRERLL